MAEKPFTSKSVLRKLLSAARAFIDRQRESWAAQSATHALGGINIIDEADYTPAQLTEYPQIGSHEHIEPQR